MMQHTMVLSLQTENSMFAQHWQAYRLEVLVHQSKLQAQKRFRLQAQSCAGLPLLALLLLVWFFKDHQQGVMPMIKDSAFSYAGLPFVI